ncbi:MAG TPA: phosphatase PAP2 family protein [Acidobacteriota bacterium]|nr:phosphatase PAP2 family protein [Acidobacteriota bacterium]
MKKSETLLIVHIVVGAALLLLGLLGLDRLVAEYLSDNGYQRIGFLTAGTHWLDTVTGKELSKFLIGLVISGCGLALLFPFRTRYWGSGALFVGIVQLLGTILSGTSKNIFGRLRPFQVIQAADWSHQWFSGGSAFPSGHAGFYFGLFLPLAYLFPVWRWPLLLVAWFIAVARVNANDHFISDIGASILLVALLALLLARPMNALRCSKPVGLQTGPRK